MCMFSFLSSCLFTPRIAAVQVLFCGPRHLTADFRLWVHLVTAPVAFFMQASINAKLSALIHTKTYTFDEMKTRGADTSVWK